MISSFVPYKMSLTNKLTTELRTQGKNADIHTEASEILAPSQTTVPPASIKPETDSKHRKPKQSKKDVYTFVTAYYKHGEYGTSVYDTLREGLLEFVDECDSTVEKETLISLDDEELLVRMLIMGTNSTCIYWQCC
jgi:hypothetical protein